MADADGAQRGSSAQAVSRDLVALMKEYHGRGPTRARTYISDNLVVCVMQQPMTKAEEHMARDHGGVAVRGSRRLYQEGMRSDATDVVEHHVGRPVRSFLGDYDIEADYLVYLFVLEPDGVDGDSQLE